MNIFKRMYSVLTSLDTFMQKNFTPTTENSPTDDSYSLAMQTRRALIAATRAEKLDVIVGKFRFFNEKADNRNILQYFISDTWTKAASTVRDILHINANVNFYNRVEYDVRIFEARLRDVVLYKFEATSEENLEKVSKKEITTILQAIEDNDLLDDGYISVWETTVAVPAVNTIMGRKPCSIISE